MITVVDNQVLACSDNSRTIFVHQEQRLIIDVSLAQQLSQSDHHLEFDKLIANLEPKDAADLRDAFERAGWLRSVELPDRRGAWPTEERLPLWRGIELFSGTDPAHSVTLHTSEELLHLPSTDAKLSRFALRMFVSQMPCSDRRSIYAALASEADVVVRGDSPVPNRYLESIYELVSANAESVCSVDIQSGRVTGQAIAWDEAANAKRIGLWQVERRASIRLGRAKSLEMCIGISSLPNLATVSLMDHESKLPGVVGVDQSVELAIAKCRAEAVERFASGAVPTHRIVRAKAQDLPNWLNPATIIAYTAAQRRRQHLREFSPKKPEYWVDGVRAERQIAVPAALVFYPFASMPDWINAGSVSSNGVAAGPTREFAQAQAWLELVERDAFQRMYALGAGAGAFRLVSNGQPALAELEDALRSFGEAIILRLHSPTEVPVVLARCDTAQGPAIGMSAKFSEVEAAEKALSEALVLAEQPFEHTIDESNVNTPGDHAALYRRPEYLSSLAWMRLSPSRETIDTEAGRNWQLPTQAVSVDLDPGVPVDLKIVRVLDPTLIPITFGYDSEPLGRPDLGALWRSRGWDGRKALTPHPFA